MTSERMRRRLEALPRRGRGGGRRATTGRLVASKARAALAIEPENADALTFLAMAEANLGAGGSASPPAPAPVAVDPERVAELAAAAERSGNPLDRLEEGIFVGRTRELERLHTALDDAVERRGSVVMLVGEPGIGKTRTTQELDAYARTRGRAGALGRRPRDRGRAAVLAVGAARPRLPRPEPRGDAAQGVGAVRRRAPAHLRPPHALPEPARAAPGRLRGGAVPAVRRDGRLPARRRRAHAAAAGAGRPALGGRGDPAAARARGARGRPGAHPRSSAPTATPTSTAATRSPARSRR